MTDLKKSVQKYRSSLDQQSLSPTHFKIIITILKLQTYISLLQRRNCSWMRDISSILMEGAL